jgi:hypothetical protein
MTPIRLEGDEEDEDDNEGDNDDEEEDEESTPVPRSKRHVPACVFLSYFLALWNQLSPNLLGIKSSLGQ